VKGVGRLLLLPAVNDRTTAMPEAMPQAPYHGPRVLAHCRGWRDARHGLPRKFHDRNGSGPGQIAELEGTSGFQRHRSTGKMGRAGQCTNSRAAHHASKLCKFCRPTGPIGWARPLFRSPGPHRNVRGIGVLFRGYGGFIYRGFRAVEDAIPLKPGGSVHSTIRDRGRPRDE